MPTNYDTIISNSPTYAIAGEPGARNDVILNQIFPQAIVNTESSKTGKQLGHKDQDGSDATKISFKDGNSYKEWYFKNVVNGVVNNGGWMKNGTTSDFNMDYSGYDAVHAPPDLSTKGPLLDSTNGAPVATNSFVPFVATLDIGNQGATGPTGIGFVVGAKNDEFSTLMETKAPTAPGVGGSAGSDSRNPAKTSKNLSAPVMTLGHYLPVPKPAGP